MKWGGSKLSTRKKKTSFLAALQAKKNTLRLVALKTHLTMLLVQCLLHLKSLCVGDFAVRFAMKRPLQLYVYCNDRPRSRSDVVFWSCQTNLDVCVEFYGTRSAKYERKLSCSPAKSRNIPQTDRFHDQSWLSAKFKDGLVLLFSFSLLESSLTTHLCSLLSGAPRFNTPRQRTITMRKDVDYMKTRMEVTFNILLVLIL